MKDMVCSKGFTLLEMIVAIGIFAVIAAISYGTLDQFLINREVIGEHRDQLRRIQTAMTLLEQDFRYASLRPVRDGFGDVQPPLVSGPGLEIGPGEVARLTTAQPNPALKNVQRLRRVAWRLGDGILSRVTWKVLDRDQDSVEYERMVLDEVDEFILSFFAYTEDEKLETLSDWQNPERLPVGVEVLITLDNGRQYRRIIEITAGV